MTSQLRKGGDLARVAGIWCNDPTFHAWLRVPDKQAARDRVCEICGVDSRAEIDHNPAASRIFNQRIREPYRLYLQAQGTSYAN